MNLQRAAHPLFEKTRDISAQKHLFEFSDQCLAFNRAVFTAVCAKACLYLEPFGLNGFSGKKFPPAILDMLQQHPIRILLRSFFFDLPPHLSANKERDPSCCLFCLFGPDHTVIPDFNEKKFCCANFQALKINSAKLYIYIPFDACF
ncbi:hypothetical protein SBDP2_950002 [Syntrophobacter sp. SbD2]|nr:hypothetical protein SBDP2_950002 [Syntrophobacter sp. SbD2]